MTQISLLPKTKIITINETSEMKKLNPTFLFVVMLMLFIKVNNAQHKLSIGDFWVYSQEYTEEKFSIIDTATFFDSLLYFEFHGVSRLIPKLSQVDMKTNEIIHSYKRRKENGFFENLVIYQNPSDTVLFEDKTYKYNAQLGEKWIYRIDIDNIDSTDIDTIWAEVVDVFEGYQFGEWRTIKKITYWTGLTDFSKYFCDDFGELSEENYLGVVSWLKGCFIDSVAYGDTSFIPVGVQDNANEASKFLLMQNYPNPFNPSTTINYSLKEKGLVKLKVYDILGKEIETLVNEEKPSGKYSVKFNGSNLPSGVYFYTIRINNFVQSRKMILLR